jgi:uncharacterized protein YkwD
MIVRRRTGMLDEVRMNSGVWTWLRPAAAALAVVVFVTLLAPCGAVAGGSSQLALTTLELSTIDSINALRIANGVEPLMISPALFGSATLHCEQMVEGGYFAHTNPDGSGFASRVASFYPQGSHRFYSVAENLLWTLHPISGAAMVTKWMNSPEHRANLLNPAWRQVAVAALSVPSAPGVFDDGPVTVVTVDFGVRR